MRSSELLRAALLATACGVVALPMACGSDGGNGAGESTGGAGGALGFGFPSFAGRVGTGGRRTGLPAASGGRAGRGNPFGTPTATTPPMSLPAGYQACEAAFCPPVTTGTACCVAANGPCGADTGSGCTATPDNGGGRNNGRGGFPGAGAGGTRGMGEGGASTAGGTPGSGGASNAGGVAASGGATSAGGKASGTGGKAGTGGAPGAGGKASATDAGGPDAGADGAP